MGKRVAKTDGGVSGHAVKRVIQQYASPLSEKEIRKIVREEKNLSGVGDNGYFLFSTSAVKKLRLNIRPNKFVIGIVSFGAVVTVEDKNFVRIS
jgi:hypothetical protein